MVKVRQQRMKTIPVQVTTVAIWFPAGDMKWSAKAMRESFYFSNICPQKPALNRGIWKELEEQSAYGRKITDLC